MSREFFKDTPPKVVFVLGLAVGIAVVTILTLILLLVNFNNTSSIPSIPTDDLTADQADAGDQAVTFDAPDEKEPILKFFVMSFCPYGEQAEVGLGPVARLFNKDAKIEPHFVIYENYCAKQGECTAEELSQFCLTDQGEYCSMHGIDELNEDVRQLCLWKYDQAKWWDYVDEVNAKCTLDNINTCWKEAAQTAKVDIGKIENCFNNEAAELLAAEKNLNIEMGVMGSPQVFVNGSEYRGARAPENYKDALCSGFKKQPKDCSKELSLAGAAATGGCN
ncbi:MAG: hypothetical protein PHS07_02220 [Patescibacteria group bacterium]|jgi:hypothetical protein|nr:hypothetical protein [Patescibacteria group bacterium]